MLRPVIQRSRPLLHHVEYLSSSSVISRSLRTRSSQSSNSRAASRQPEDSTSNVPNQPPEQKPPPPVEDVSSALSNIEPTHNALLAPVHIPEDQNAVLRSDHPSTNLLANSGLVVTRQLEMMNVFLGFEQANKYVIMDPHGNHVGYMAEQEGGIGKSVGRQVMRTHRPFTTHVFDRHAQEVLRFYRPFSMIKSRMRVYDPWEAGRHISRSNETGISTSVKDTGGDGVHTISQMPLEAMRIIGEAHSEWAPMRRKYNLFLSHELDPTTKEIPGHDSPPADKKDELPVGPNFRQFAFVDEPILSWDFSLKGADGNILGFVNRNWRGFGRELFTDTGMYVLSMDSAGQQVQDPDQRSADQKPYSEVLGGGEMSSMTLDQRAVVLATAVTVDFDYFSRHSHAGGHGLMPLWIPGMGGEAGAGAGAGAAGAEAGAAGAGAEIGGVGAGAAGRGIAGSAAEIGAGEGAIAGAGTMAGYEAMQRGMGRGDYAESAPESGSVASEDPNSPTYGTSSEQDQDLEQDGWGGEQQSGDVWGSGEQDPWNATDSGAEGGSEGGGGIISSLWESFFGD